MTDLISTPGVTVRYFDNGFRAGVVRGTSPRRSGTPWILVQEEDGKVRKHSDSELRLGNDDRMKAIIAMTPAEQAEALEAYLEASIARAEALRVVSGDTDQPEAPKTRGRVSKPVDENRVTSFIAAVQKLKVASKGQIQKMIGEFTASDWNKTVKAALASGQIESHGKLRGTKYTIPGFKVEKVAPQDTQDVKDYAQKVADYLVFKGDNRARAEIMSNNPTDNATYQAAMKLLIEQKKITKTGSKRGTRYHVA